MLIRLGDDGDRERGDDGVIRRADGADIGEMG